MISIEVSNPKNFVVGAIANSLSLILDNINRQDAINLSYEVNVAILGINVSVENSLGPKILYLTLRNAIIKRTHLPTIVDVYRLMASGLDPEGILPHDQIISACRSGNYEPLVKIFTEFGTYK